VACTARQCAELLLAAIAGLLAAPSIPGTHRGQLPLPAPCTGPRQYGKRVEKLRSVCRAATITIPPTLYVRNKGEGALEAALEELLAKHGLDADSGAATPLPLLLVLNCSAAAVVLSVLAVVSSFAVKAGGLVIHASVVSLVWMCCAQLVRWHLPWLRCKDGATCHTNLHTKQHPPAPSTPQASAPLRRSRPS